MRRKLFWITCALLIFVSGGILVRINKTQVSATNKCPVKIQEKTVRGSSLSPLIEASQEIKLLFGYYNCQPVEKEDIVAYDYSGRENPIIKIVKAIPGDKFYLEKAGNGWRIFVNNEVLKNSESKPYLLSENSYKMLSLYQQDYKGVIPENTYLLLGNLAGGSLDSSSFGLVDKKDILGKVIIK